MLLHSRIVDSKTILLFLAKGIIRGFGNIMHLHAANMLVSNLKLGLVLARGLT